MSDWFKVHRRIFESAVFVDPELFRLWIWCIGRANHTAKYIPVKTGRGYVAVAVGRGEFICGRKRGSEVFGCSESTFDRRMKRLEDLQMITTDSTSHYTKVTVSNYAEYQDRVDESEQASDQRNRCSNADLPPDGEQASETPRSQPQKGEQASDQRNPYSNAGLEGAGEQASGRHREQASDQRNPCSNADLAPDGEQASGKHRSSIGQASGTDKNEKKDKNSLSASEKNDLLKDIIVGRNLDNVDGRKALATYALLQVTKGNFNQIAFQGIVEKLADYPTHKAIGYLLSWLTDGRFMPNWKADWEFHAPSESKEPSQPKYQLDRSPRI